MDGNVDLEVKTNIGASGLFLATVKGHVGCVAMLLDNGANVNAISNGFTAAQTALISRKRTCFWILTAHPDYVDLAACFQPPSQMLQRMPASWSI
jgi:ankyrin repeat protein